jgi:hypothetical protein
MNLPSPAWRARGWPKAGRGLPTMRSVATLISWRWKVDSPPPSRHCEARSPHLVIARSAATWQSSSIQTERIDAVFPAVGSGRAFRSFSPFLFSVASLRMVRSPLPPLTGHPPPPSEEGESIGRTRHCEGRRPVAIHRSLRSASTLTKANSRSLMYRATALSRARARPECVSCCPTRFLSAGRCRR